MTATFSAADPGAILDLKMKFLQMLLSDAPWLGRYVHLDGDCAAEHVVVDDRGAMQLTPFNAKLIAFGRPATLFD